MTIILVVILYYILFGFLTAFSWMNNLGLAKKLVTDKTLFNIYITAELIITSFLVLYAVSYTNSILIIIGGLMFISAFYSIWKREDLLMQLEVIDDQYDLISAFMSLLLAFLIYFFDLAYSTI
jgi:hypothetical protein|tara:strand:+ start:9367 stop:9735 length:369 start_codon:yes stop_codon:yes gene_type:complete